MGQELFREAIMNDQERKLLHHLSRFVSDHKKQFIDNVLSNRTRRVTVVLEDIYQSQNASAVVRTCECLGLQDIHIVENTAQYQINVRVLKGSNKWLDMYRYRDKGINNSERCFEHLKKEGYRILVADPSEDCASIHDIDAAKDKVALVFGNELRGLSTFAWQNADEKVKIPMYGFTESLNISASVAISLSSLLTKLRQSEIDYGLSPQEREEITLSWYRKIVRRSDTLEREFLRTIK
jgi:tRNA (guanosine-2'-O-)-methyltransferase